MKILKLIGISIVVPCILWGRDFPALTGPVIDEINLLTDSQIELLETNLKSFYEQKGIQIQLVIIDSLEGDNLEEFSIRLAEKWKIGKAKKDTGTLFLIVFKDRKMRIEVGSGLEGDLTDAESKRIIDESVLFFKRGEYAQGIFLGLESISQRLGGELSLVVQDQHGKDYSLIAVIMLFFFLILFSIITMTIKALKGEFRRKGWKRVFISSGRSTWGGGGSGSGGGGWSSGSSWSGGGGSFSGGGASGSW